MKVDFQTRTTETGWQRIVDEFWLMFTPKWFEWMEWLLILGAISYLSNTTKSSILSAISAISYVALAFYFQAFFYRLELKNLPLIKTPTAEFVVSAVASAILTITFYLTVMSVVPLLGNSG